MDVSVNDIVTSHLNAVKAGIAERMAAQGRNASGRSVRSLDVQSTDNGGALYGSSSFLVMEKGRGPGKVPADFISIIRAWIVAKGISYNDLIPKNGTPTQGLARLSGAIAYNIMKKGTRLYRDKGYNSIYSELVDEELEKLAKEISSVFETEADRLHQERFGNEEIEQ